jgi:hypothetical protein
MNDDVTGDNPTTEQLLALAASKIARHQRWLATGQHEAATALLALHTVSITPEQSAAVAGLDVATIDVVRYRDRLSDSRRQPDPAARLVPYSRSSRTHERPGSGRGL